MNKSELEKVLKEGNMSLEGLKKMQFQAKALGLSKRVIHIELDLSTGNLKSQASPMDHVMHLGMLEFYKATVIGNMLNKPISKNEEQPLPTVPAVPPSPIIPPADTPAPAPEQASSGDAQCPAAEAPAAAPEPAPDPAAAPDPAPAPVAAAVVDPKTEGGAPAA